METTVIVEQKPLTVFSTITVVACIYSPKGSLIESICSVWVDHGSDYKDLAGVDLQYSTYWIQLGPICTENFRCSDLVYSGRAFYSYLTLTPAADLHFYINSMQPCL